MQRVCCCFLADLGGRRSCCCDGASLLNFGCSGASSRRRCCHERRSYVALELHWSRRCCIGALPELHWSFAGHVRAIVELVRSYNGASPEHRCCIGAPPGLQWSSLDVVGAALENRAGLQWRCEAAAMRCCRGVVAIRRPQDADLTAEQADDFLGNHPADSYQRPNIYGSNFQIKKGRC